MTLSRNPFDDLSGRGGLHRWTFNQNVLKYVPTAATRNNLYANLKVATCSDWSVLNTSVSPANYPLPIFPSSLPANAHLNVSGSVDIYSYLGSNCTNSPQTALIPLLKFRVVYTTPSGATGSYLYTNKTAAAYGFTGNCAAPGNLYRNNATLEDNRFNLAWWSSVEGIIGEGMNTTDVHPGYLWGAAPSAWFARSPDSNLPDPLTSIVLIPAAGGSFCCNIKWIYHAADVLPLGQNCSSPGSA